MRILGTLMVSALAIALGASSAPCQSLAEAAAKEKERRKAVKPTKVITEDELRSGTAASVPAAPADTDAKAADAKPVDAASPKPGATAAPKEKTDDELRAEKSKDWNARVAQTQAEITRIQGEIDKAQAALGDLSGNLYGGQRSTQISRVESGKVALAQANQKMDELREEGRRNRY